MGIYSPLSHRENTFVKIHLSKKGDLVDVGTKKVKNWTI
ncbi:hypothetical protein SBF1_1730002 [Candidatus Desulfosporosinus infrequens]|uniref:Uncharacterized protein n=1 Tax=Candidatus Desulfosporosinus infrequens TaxID=2043169 RepID=A0A2U3KC06_9FIRM|nr:hypothetical protein SBF1_1730002 [Candidatus Desulfosporosinus infrequens]